MEKRVLGRTGEHLSVVGFGGIVVRNETPESARDIVAEAIRRGVNYFDVAPSYGNAEERLGPALEPYRDSVFLACKTEQRSRDDARLALHTSLERLRTKHFDLYQLHGVTTMAEVDQILRPGGALEAFQEAQQRGEIKYIGFSAHSEEAAIALMEGFPFDSMLFPINWVAWHIGQFGPRAVQAALDRGMGILALKALAKRSLAEGEARPWAKAWYAPVENYKEAKLGLRFTLSQPVTAAVSPGHAELLWWACDAADEFKPLTPREDRALAEKGRDLTPVFPLA